MRDKIGPAIGLAVIVLLATWALWTIYWEGSGGV